MFLVTASVWDTKIFAHRDVLKCSSCFCLRYIFWLPTSLLNFSPEHLVRIDLLQLNFSIQVIEYWHRLSREAVKSLPYRHSAATRIRSWAFLLESELGLMPSRSLPPLTILWFFSRQDLWNKYSQMLQMKTGSDSYIQLLSPSSEKSFLQSVSKKCK